MANRNKEVAKFLAGLAANQTIVHWGLGLSAALPLSFGVIVLTPTLNTFAMVFWPIATFLLIYYAWVKR